MVKNKVTVKINGNEYIMKGEESQETMLEVASYVDDEIKKLTAINNKLNPTFAAVLSSLNIANEFFKVKKLYEEIKISSQDPIHKLNELREIHENTVKENSKLKSEADRSRNELDGLKSESSSLQSQYEGLYNDYTAKCEELSKSYREYELMKREKESKQKELERVKNELSDAKYKLVELQNQLMQNQIELVKTKKEFDEYKLGYNQESKAGNK